MTPFRTLVVLTLMGLSACGADGDPITPTRNEIAKTLMPGSLGPVTGGGPARLYRGF